ncbi:MAG TPA: ABC transporter substrate-binding protein, partial [Arthrobacter sp.]
GTFTGTLKSAAGVITPITNAATSVGVTQAAATGSCKILDLTLGPLHLDLLGLVVDLYQVHLTITAQPGNGNLLGNLLCSVANLLNGGTGLTGLANLLNQLLGL